MVRPRRWVTFLALGAANAAAWSWALVAFRGYPLLLGTALLAYGLGLRHAVDADHIAAIDNVTRKLMGENKRPVNVGLWFSLGHSTVVVLASIAIAATALAFNARAPAWRGTASAIGTLVSIVFLLAVAGMNAFILADVYRTLAAVRRGDDVALRSAAPAAGLLSRVFRPVFGAVRESWHMYPVGVLFGLGFDTATEIGLLGISAAGGARGMSMWSILVFPALFTAGMALVDTADSVLMVGAYGWALAQPVRRVYYNLMMTAASMVAALVIAAVEAVGLVRA